MADPRVVDIEMEEDYDEEEDSDFDASSNDEVMSSSSGEDNDEADTTATKRPGKRKQKISKSPKPTPLEQDLDSGDEAALEEYRKEQKRSKKKGEPVEEVSDEADSGWRAKTRAMRDRERVEKRRRRPLQAANITIDVDKMWEDMNRPDTSSSSTTPVHASHDTSQPAKPSQTQWLNGKRTLAQHPPQDIENQPPPGSSSEETITIHRTYKFAGQTTTETKTVPKSSAEARLYLSQQSATTTNTKPNITAVDGRTMRRPLRRISRFDPNAHNLDAFKISWNGLRNANADRVKAKKINVVDKSKQDWAADVDQKGDREELERHARSKKGYLGQQDTLSRLAQARDENRLGRPDG